jgi:ABC-type microcin C transport system permease subunit YejE
MKKVALILFMLLLVAGNAFADKFMLINYESKFIRSNSAYAVLSWKTTIKSEKNMNADIVIKCLDNDDFVLQKTTEHKKFRKGINKFSDTWMVHKSTYNNTSRTSIGVYWRPSWE